MRSGNKFKKEKRGKLLKLMNRIESFFDHDITIRNFQILMLLEVYSSNTTILIFPKTIKEFQKYIMEKFHII